MSNAASNYLELEILDHVLGQGARNFTSPASLFIALFTADPGEASSFTNEVANSNAYARTAVAFAVASGGSAATSATVTFPTASGGNFGTVTHIAICDSGTYGAGNQLFYGALTASKVVNDGDTFTIQSGQLTVALA